MKRNLNLETTAFYSLPEFCALIHPLPSTGKRKQVMWLENHDLSDDADETTQTDSFCWW